MKNKLPSSEEIRKACLIIQSEWSDEERLVYKKQVKFFASKQEIIFNNNEFHSNM